MNQPSRWELIAPRLSENSVEAWLASKNPAKYGLADEVLAKLGDEQAFLLLTHIAAAEEKRRKRRGVRNLLIGMVGVTGADLVLSLALSGHGHHSYFNGGGMCGAFAGQSVQGGMPSSLHKQAILRLTKFADRRAFPLFVDAINTPHVLETKAVALWLIDMLPTLNEYDFAKLSKAQRTHFFRFVNPSGSTQKLDAETRRDLARALMYACARMGTIEALKPIQKMATAQTQTRNGSRSTDCPELPAPSRKMA